MWNKTAEVRPPNGATVRVITDGGDERTLKFQDNLWWLPDMSMYVYFTPMLWRVQ